MVEFAIVSSHSVGWVKQTHMELWLEDRKRRFLQLSPKRRANLLHPLVGRIPSTMRTFAGQERDFPQHYILAIQSRPGLPFGRPSPASWFVFTGHRETEVYSETTVATLVILFASHGVTA
jgi:hypothetical protein